MVCRYAGRAFDSEKDVGGPGTLMVKGLKSMWRQAPPIVRNTLQGVLTRIIMQVALRLHKFFIRFVRPLTAQSLRQISCNLIHSQMEQHSGSFLAHAYSKSLFQLLVMHLHPLLPSRVCSPPIQTSIMSKGNCLRHRRRM